MKAALLDRRVAFERAVLTENDLGEEDQDWQPYAAAWAKVERAAALDRRARDVPMVDREEATAPGTFVIRWSSVAAELTPADRILFERVVWNIHSVSELGRRDGLQIVAFTNYEPARRKLAGLVAGGSSLTATLLVTIAIAGEIDGAGGLGATLIVLAPLAGVVAGAGAIGGLLTVNAPLLGTIAGAAAVAGTVTVAAPLAGQIAGTGGVVSDPDTVLLFGFDGADGSTSLVDESRYAHSPTCNGAAAISAAQSRFGGSSLSLPGSLDSVTVGGNGDLNFGAAAFTIEGWFKGDTSAGSFAGYLIRQYETAGNQRSWRLLRQGANLVLAGSADGATVVTLASGAWAPNDEIWYHVAADFDGTTYRIYVDGIMIGSGTATIALFAAAANLTIGGNLGATNGFGGWVDEVRITKGTARYASDSGFTPPSSAFPRRSAGALDVRAPLAGAVNGAGTLAGLVSVNAPLAAVVAGTGTVAAGLDVRAPLAGAVSGSAAVAAALVVQAPLAGSVAGASAVAAGLGVTAPLAGAISGTGTTAAALTAQAPLAGAISGVGAVTGALSVVATAPFSSVVLLAGFEGADGSTSVTDEGANGHTLTCNNTAAISTAESKFGSSSLFLSGGLDNISAGDSADWAFGSGAFTVEGWFRGYTAAGSFAGYLVRQYESAGNQRSWRFLTLSGNLTLSGSANGSTVTTLASGAWSPSDNVWYHLAADFDGTKYRIYVDGVMIGSGTTTISLFDATSNLAIGGNVGITNGFGGYVDELRITKGYARYASDAGFTPPSSAFPRS